jgi:hypothetical protein
MNEPLAGVRPGLLGRPKAVRGDTIQGLYAAAAEAGDVGGDIYSTTGGATFRSASIN